MTATARDYGFTVAAHAHGAEAIRRAVLGGVDSIEHGTFMDAEDMKLMVEHGTWYVPTIIAGDFVARHASVPGYYPPQVAAKAAAIGPLILATAGRAYKAHVKIAFGTDAAVYPHGQNAHNFAAQFDRRCHPSKQRQSNRPGNGYAINRSGKKFANIQRRPQLHAPGCSVIQPTL